MMPIDNGIVTIAAEVRTLVSPTISIVVQTFEAENIKIWNHGPDTQTQ